MMMLDTPSPGVKLAHLIDSVNGRVADARRQLDEQQKFHERARAYYAAMQTDARGHAPSRAFLRSCAGKELYHASKVTEAITMRALLDAVSPDTTTTNQER